ncbi:MAG: response regulator [Alphaproteobacteria bacterium]|jgi:CheY-like chemotaxis protein|uniref:Response regulator n=1 Tax=Sphingomonas longa TaxID=2778730 RepID=A0ABS2D7I4_9SPHN|nr:MULTISPECIES: response regulator [Alphaproteobacteria]MBM6576885.1 response regulator [Sphingomonas sp. BT552]MBR7709929.1 response regulator [Microvirga sp. SRT01]RYY09315.1 MAG: response regulator [Alphaproteobacteria bacterium]
MEPSTTPFALVVEDEPLILMETCAILEDAGFRVYDADDGDRAKELLDRHSDSVILLFSDVDMPGSTLDGFALARHVAATHPHIEIVIASGRVKPSDGDMPDKATFINKPFNQQMVIGHLAKTLPDHKKPEPLKTAI